MMFQEKNKDYKEEMIDIKLYKQELKSNERNNMAITVRKLRKY